MAYSPFERMWTRPSLTVIALESQPILGSSNQIVDSARARLSLRTVPSMDSREAGELLIRKLTRNPPHGAHVAARIVRSTPWWATDPEGPAFDAARRALKAGFGRDAVMMGAGGSIGFVQPFADFLEGAPCLLTGVEDPACGAHSENESLHLGDWKKCMRAAVHLYDELSRVTFAAAAAHDSERAGSTTAARCCATSCASARPGSAARSRSSDTCSATSWSAAAGTPRTNTARAWPWRSWPPGHWRRSSRCTSAGREAER